MTGTTNRISDGRIAEIQAMLDAHLERHREHITEGVAAGCGCNAYEDVINGLPEYDPEDPGNLAIAEWMDEYVLNDGTQIDGERPGWRITRPHA